MTDSITPCLGDSHDELSSAGYLILHFVLIVLRRVPCSPV